MKRTSNLELIPSIATVLCRKLAVRQVREKTFESGSGGDPSAALFSGRETPRLKLMHALPGRQTEFLRDGGGAPKQVERGRHLFWRLLIHFIPPLTEPVCPRSSD